MFSLALGRHLVVSFIVFSSAAVVKPGKDRTSPNAPGRVPRGRRHRVDDLDHHRAWVPVCSQESSGGHEACVAARQAFGQKHSSTLAPLAS